MTPVFFHVFQVSQYEKREKLLDILKDLPGLEKEKTLIFLEKKKTADFLATILSDNGVSMLYWIFISSKLLY